MIFFYNFANILNVWLNRLLDSYISIYGQSVMILLIM